MFHFDAKYETYYAFFAHLAAITGVQGVYTKMLEDAELVFGLNEERAFVNAIRAVFHLSEHVYCSRHITENVRRHLTDQGVDVRTRQQAVAFVKQCNDVNADSSAACDDVVDRLMEFIAVEMGC